MTGPVAARETLWECAKREEEAKERESGKERSSERERQRQRHRSTARLIEAREAGRAGGEERLRP